VAGVLKIVCTPIGNLGDISSRAIETLKSSTLILAESTSHSRKLLTALHVDLKNIKLLSCSQHEEENRTRLVIKRLEKDDIISLISDAGAPTISDPGGRLVEAVIAAGHRIEVIPGPSAVIAALMGAGLVTTRFAFLGFLTRKGKERERLIKNARAMNLAIVIYESPHRVEKTLADLLKWCGPKRVVVARELTKQFETFHRGILGQTLFPLFVEKGEAVIVVEGGDISEENSSSELIEEEIAALLQQKCATPRKIANYIAQKNNVSSKKAYALVLQIKKQKDVFRDAP
jgi:16S rRNA (cytidine1402-2'-O)-methyltransferase